MYTSASNSASFRPPTWSESTEKSDGETQDIIPGLPNPMRLGDTYGEVWRGYYTSKFDAVLTHREWVEPDDTGGANVGLYPFADYLKNTKFQFEFWIDNGPHYFKSIKPTTNVGKNVYDIDGTVNPPSYWVDLVSQMLGNPHGVMWKGTLYFYIHYMGRKMKYSIYCNG